jgi:cell wall-associated NlpC family hydrolase
MKKLLTISAIVLLALSSSVPAAGDQEEPTLMLIPSVKPNFSLEWIVELKKEQTQLEAEAEQQEALEENTRKLNNAIEAVTDRVGKTRYVFSGSTPSGWDCSGLVMWVYSKLGVELQHSASIQQYAGVTVEQPKLGDIVVFKYNGRKSAHHVGIYLYPDTMIHAGGGKGDETSIVSISKFAGEHSKVIYKRVIETQ